MPMRRALLLLFLLTGTASSAWAQFETGNVVGTIKDSTGGVVPGANIVFTVSAGTNLSETFGVAIVENRH